MARRFDKHLESAKAYIEQLSSKRNDIRFFCDFPLQMAERTLQRALRSPEWLESGEAPKVPRSETLLLLQKLSLVYALPSLWKP